MKESGLVADAGHLEDGDSCLEASLHLSGEAAVVEGGRGGQKKEMKGGG